MTGILISEDITSREILRIASQDKDTNIFRVYDRGAGYAATGKYGFDLRYLGSGSGVNNSLALYTDNQTASSQIQVFVVDQSGNVTYKTATNFTSSLTQNGVAVSLSNHSHDASALINTLSVGSSIPEPSCYIITQDSAGGSATTYYKRRSDVVRQYMHKASNIISSSQPAGSVTWYNTGTRV